MTPANASLRAGEFTFALPFGRAQPAERPAAFRSRAVPSRTGSCRTRSISDGCVIKGRSTTACIRRLSTGRRGRMYSIGSRHRRSLGEHPARRSFLPRGQALRRSRKQDGREPCFQGRTLLAILRVARRAIGTQARGWVDHAHPGCRDRRPRFARGRDLFGESRKRAITDHHINRNFRGGNVSGAQRERPPADTPLGKNIRNAIDRVTVGATRIEIVLCKSIVGEGQDRLLEFPWTRTSSRRRHEIIQGVDELKRPQRAMRTKAQVGFVKAFGAAHRWLDELLSDANTSLNSLAVREGKSERSIRIDSIPRFSLPRPGGSRDGRTPSAWVQHQAPDRAAGALVRAMDRLGTREPIQAQAAIGG